MTESSKVKLNGAAFGAILRKYLIEHSSRRLNFLYWNITDAKDMTLNFVNLSGKELNRINNCDLVYRIVRIKNSEDWNVISDFINSYIVNQDEPRAVCVIRVDYLISYLKSINFDLDKVVLTRGAFGTVYCNDDDEAKRKPICTIDTDIQSLYLIDRLYLKYRKMVFSDSSDWRIQDITESYLNDTKLRFELKDLNISIPITDALDVVSRKFITEYRARDTTCRLDQIYLPNGLSTVVSRLSCSDLTIVSVRVYIQVFLKKYNKKRK